jgi:hypothetical protein
MQSVENEPVVWRNIMPPFSVFMSKPSKKLAWSRQQAKLCFYFQHTSDVHIPVGNANIFIRDFSSIRVSTQGMMYPCL